MANACSGVIDWSTMRKSSFAVLPRISLSREGSCRAGHLNENAVGALALDRRLDQAELVDAALDDLNRLIDGLTDALDQRSVRGGERDEAAVFSDIDAALSRRAEDP